MSVQLHLFLRDLNPVCFSDLATTAVAYWPDLILYTAYLAEDEHVLAELVRFPHLEVQGHVLVLPLHLVGDLVEERGPDLESNPVSYKSPTTNAKPIFPLLLQHDAKSQVLGCLTGHPAHSQAYTKAVYIHTCC